MPTNCGSAAGSHAVIAECHRQQSDWGSAADRAAKPSAIATALPIAATGVSLIAAVVWGIALAGTVAPTTVAVLMLVPLAAFEAFTALPAAATALTRAGIAARRLNDLAGPAVQPQRRVSVVTPRVGELAACGLRCGYSPHAGADPITVTLARGARAVITGPSGAGKTALLMTLAGLLPPLHGGVTLDGQSLQSISEPDLVRRVGFFAEDAHVFATTVRDNLLVARGDCGDDEIVDALDRVGLHRWRSGLPDGLATVLTGGAQAVSAGQRRRLLLARALLSPPRSYCSTNRPSTSMPTTPSRCSTRFSIRWWDSSAGTAPSSSRRISGPLRDQVCRCTWRSHRK